MQVKLIICHPTLFSVTSMHGGLAGVGGARGGTAATPVESVTFSFPPIGCSAIIGRAGGSGIGDGVGAAAASTPVARKESPEMRRRVNFMVRGHCVSAHQCDSAA